MCITSPSTSCVLSGGGKGVGNNLMKCGAIILTLVLAQAQIAEAADVAAEIRALNNAISSLFNHSIQANVAAERYRVQSEKVNSASESIDLTEDELSKLDVERAKTQFLLSSLKDKLDKETDNAKKEEIEAEILPLQKEMVGYAKAEENLKNKKMRLENLKGDEMQRLTPLESKLKEIEEKSR